MTDPEDALGITRPGTDSPFPPDCAARYRAVKLLGRGGFGDVFLADQISLRRRVAVKLLNIETLAEESQRARLLEEARITGSLRSPHIVRMLECGHGDGRPWIVFEYLEGPTLDRCPGGREWSQVLNFGVQIASALAEAHRHGIVHRDLKPANILVVENDQLKILDFGIAKWISDSRVRTEAGILLGTPRYMPHEVFLGAPSTPGWDVYSTGVLLIEIGLGNVPFPKDLAAIMHAKRTDEVLFEALEGSGVPTALRRVLLRATATDTATRYPDGEALLSALEEVALRTSSQRRVASTQRIDEQAGAIGGDTVVDSDPLVDAGPQRGASGARRAIGAGEAGAPGARRGRWLVGGAALVTLAAVTWVTGAVAPPSDPAAGTGAGTPGSPASPSPVTSVTISSSRTEILDALPAGFTARRTIDRRSECRAHTQRNAEVTPKVWDTGSVDFFFDPRSGTSPVVPAEAVLEFEISGEIPVDPPPTLVLNERPVCELPHVQPADGVIRVAIAPGRLMPGLNRASLRRDPPDSRLTRRVTRLTLQGRGYRPAGDVRHFFEPVGDQSPRPGRPPSWEKMMVAKGGQVNELLVSVSTQALAEDPANPWSRWSLACGLDLMDQPAAALPSYAAATEVARHEVWILSDLGRCLSKLGRLEEANLFLERAVERAQQSKNLGCVFWSAKNLAANATARQDSAGASRWIRLADEARALDDAAHPDLKSREDIRAVGDFLR